MRSVDALNLLVTPSADAEAKKSDAPEAPSECEDCCTIKQMKKKRASAGVLKFPQTTLMFAARTRGECT